MARLPFVAPGRLAGGKKRRVLDLARFLPEVARDHLRVFPSAGLLDRGGGCAPAYKFGCHASASAVGAYAVQFGTLGEGLHAAVDGAGVQPDHEIGRGRVGHVPKRGDGGGKPIDEQAEIFALPVLVRLAAAYEHPAALPPETGIIIMGMGTRRSAAGSRARERG